MSVVMACAMAFGTGSAAAADAGMQVHALWADVDHAEMVRQLDQAAAANASVIRVDVGWASVEGDGKGQWSDYHLGRLDAVVAEANARHIKPLLTLAESPCWASSAPDSVKQGCRGEWWNRGVTKYLPSDPRDYADALAFLAERYGSRVAGWEIWNEPNLEYFSHGPDKARRYAALLKAAYPRAKAAAPGVPVIAGALSECDVAFTEALYAAGIKGFFDAFSIHPYSHDVSPLAPREDGYRQESFVRGVPAVHDVMLAHGDDKPLWLTEFGWSTNSVRGVAPWRDGVDLDQQAKFVRQALGQVANWSYVPVAIYYNLKDQSADASDLVSNYGLTRADGSPKPSFAAFAAAAKKLETSADRPPKVPPTLEVSVPSGGTTSVTVPSPSPASPEGQQPAQPAAPEGAQPTPARRHAARHGGRKRGRTAARRRNRLSVSRRGAIRLRARGVVSGVRRVTLVLRRLKAHGVHAASARTHLILRRKAHVRRSGRFAATLKPWHPLTRGTYRVALRTRRGREAYVLLRVR